ncbi:MAG: hypothetical protein JWN04_4245 [Myxococcaceae bacterium]|nr:hypothetical protein [Myxococcaceae bacterium]
MQKAVVVTAAAAAVVVGAFTGVAAWSGSAVTTRLEQQTAELEKTFPMLKVVDQKIERGLFSSTRSFTLRFGCMPSVVPPDATSGKPPQPEPLELHWRDVIHHGPFPGGSGLGLASIDSELVSPPAWKARIEQLTSKRPLVAVHTAIDLHGAVTSDLTVPPLHYTDPALGTFDTKGLSARTQLDASYSAARGGSYTVDMPGIELSARAVDGTSLTMKIGPSHGKTEVGPRPDPTLWFGPLKSSGTTSSLELLGTAALGLPVKPVQASFKELKFDAVSTLDKGLFSSTNHMTAKGLINQVAIDQVELRASVKRIDAASYQKLVRTMFGSVFSCDAAVQQAGMDSALAALQSELSTLLVHNPEYSLDTLAVELGGKRAELSYSFGTAGITSADAGQPLPALMLTKGVLRASVKVHTGLIAQIIKQLGGLDPAAAAAAGLPSGAGASDQTLALVNSMTDQFVQLGYIERDGESLKASASYQAGSVLVNGKPMALPDFGALAGGK